MTRHARWTRRTALRLVLTGIALAAGHAASAQTPAAAAARDGAGKQARVAFAHPLPPLAGHHLRVAIVEVRYGPGGSSTPHSHPCPGIGYVVQGALRTQVQGEPAAVYHAGESFYEAPDGIHLVAANASRTDSVRFLAYFTCDHDTPLSVAAPGSNH